MVRTSKGSKFRTRSIFRKSPRSRGLPPPSRLLEAYAIGDKVDIVVEPAVQKGQPHRRFHGKTAVVAEQRGNCYVVTLKDGNKQKFLTIRPEHIRRHFD
jgi:large subunit ribosomal protein L21e